MPNGKQIAPRNRTTKSSSVPSTITTTNNTNPTSTLSAILSCRINQNTSNGQQPLNMINDNKQRRLLLSPSSSMSLTKSIYKMRTKQQQQQQKQSQHFTLCRDGKENIKVIDWVVPDEEYMNYIMDKRRNSIIR